MPILVFDTGFLYSLVVDRRYSNAAKELWSDTELLVPHSVESEIKYRVRNPDQLPPELPRNAVGLITSSSWTFRVVELTEEEEVEVERLRSRLGSQGPLADRGECEGAVLLAGRYPDAVLAVDDRKCLDVLGRYVESQVGRRLSHQNTSSTLDELVRAELLSAADRGEVSKKLEKKGRPFT